MKAALRTLAELCADDNRIAVLGEIKEFGSQSEPRHRDVGERAAATAFLVTVVFGNFIIRKLVALKLGQPVRAEAEVHRLAELHGGKQGTPTMGGVLIIGAVLISSLLWARLDNRFVWLVLFSMVYLGALGFADDYLKVTKRKSEGISSRFKLVFQIVLAAIVTGVFLTSPLLEVQARALYVPFIKAPVIANMAWF